MPTSKLARAFLLAPFVVAGAACSSSAANSSASVSAPTTTTLPSQAAATSGPPTQGPPTQGPPAQGSGPVDVLYAGSLVTLMDHDLGPAFQAATGYTFNGVSGDSGALANQIKGKTLQGDVFISANPAKDQLLEGPANGAWVSWYAGFATSELVLGYNPHSRFAGQLRTRPWYDVITEPGFLLGRTDPTTDPKGKLTATALNDAATADGAATKALAASTSNVFPENTLVGRLQAGQLDAGFFYRVEAVAAGIPAVALSGVAPEKAQYTVTVLRGAPHSAAAGAFIGFLLGSNGRALMARAGLSLVQPLIVTGNPPSDLQAVLSGP